MDAAARSRLRPALLALPGLALAGAGLFHPHHLTWQTSSTWTVLHLLGILVFPLVGVALAWLVRGRTDAVAWAARLLAYLYATAYTALDVVSGVGAGYATYRLGEGVPRAEAVRYLFSIGGRIGEVGSWALIACTALLTLDLVRRTGLAAAPGLLGVLGAWLVHVDHIFAPIGVLGMTLLGLVTGWLGWVASRPAPR